MDSRGDHGSWCYVWCDRFLPCGEESRGSIRSLAARSMWHRAPVLTGSRTTGEDRYYHLVLLAENNMGYANLMKIVSKGFVDGLLLSTPCGYGGAGDIS